MPIQNLPTALPGIPAENSFHYVDETGIRCGTAVVIEFVNHTLLPSRPLNYYISINATTERAFDMLIGAAVARSFILRWRSPNLDARIYAPCKPHDMRLLRSLQDFGFKNDDAVFRMRRIVSQGEHFANPPVGCTISQVLLEDQQDLDGLLDRVNTYSVIAHNADWLARLMQEQLFTVLGVWRDSSLLGELVLTAYGAEGRVEMLYTRPEHRRRGVASALVSAAAIILLRNGIRSLNAEVWRRNQTAMSTFESLRFESVSPTILYPGMDI